MRFDFSKNKKQEEALLTIFDDNIDEVLYGGAKGGGKSVFGCIFSYLMAKLIIKSCKLTSTKYPIPVGFMGRKQSVDFRDTTLDTWKKTILADAYTIREQQKLIVIENTVSIRFGGMDETEESNVKKFNSGEYAFYFIDQAEEVTEQDIGLVRSTLRLKINGQELKYKGLLTANPRICWLKDNFIDNPQPRTKFIQALPSDNGYLASTYLDQLKKAFAFRPELLRAYLFGNWDQLDVSNVVIPVSVVRENINNNQHDTRVIKKITVCDVADMGDDETVIYDFENTKVVNQEIYSHRSLMDTVGRIIAHAKRNGSNLICNDKIGEGAGVTSRLLEVYEKDKGMTIYGYDSRVQAGDAETFINHRAESWWMAGKKFADRVCDIPNDPVLVSQLSGVTYLFKSNGKIAITPKDELKKILKHSPDRAEAYIMGLDALSIAIPIHKVDPYFVEERRKLNPMTV